MLCMTSVASVDHSVAEMATFHSVFILICECNNFVITRTVNRNKTVVDSVVSCECSCN